MNAALFDGHRLTVKRLDVRPLRRGEALVQVHACGICGTDIHIVEGIARSSPPVVLGHEYAGVVLDVSADTLPIAVGSRVAIDPNIHCGECPWCRRGHVHLCSDLCALGVDRDGGMAERCIVPVQQLYTIPDQLSFDAAAFIEPISCAIHGIDQARIALGDTVVLLGGGTIGLLMLQLARSAGAARVLVVEPLERKRALARSLGADPVIDPLHTNVRSAVFDLTGIGADVVIECAGRTETAQLAVQLARRGGTVEFFGVCPIGERIALEPNAVYFNELTIVGSYINPHTFNRAIALLSSGRVNVEALMADAFPLESVYLAIRAFKEGRAIKSIIHPQS
ncbi:MAG: alcohol dehydrogenase [Ignavibacteria bacterium]